MMLSVLRLYSVGATDTIVIRVLKQLFPLKDIYILAQLVKLLQLASSFFFYFNMLNLTALLSGLESTQQLT
jgi:hypothetical protein